LESVQRLEEQTHYLPMLKGAVQIVASN